MHVLKGAQHVFPCSGGFDPLEIFELANFFQRAHLFAAPTMVKRMTKAAQHKGVNVSGLRSVIYGGGPMYLSDIVDATACFGWNCWPYGLSSGAHTPVRVLLHTLDNLAHAYFGAWAVVI